MGLPGFFLWLWKKYKSNNFVFCREKLDDEMDKEIINNVNNLDSLFIDCNCAIHPMCFKVLKDYNGITDQKKLEGLMIKEVLDYIDHLTKYVNPRKLLYIAIDGVAPVAKIKQQRIRRFKSVHDKVLFDNIKKKHGKEVSNSWNNSAITPGTAFMSVLTQTIKEFCVEKQKIYNCEIIFSCANTPSEGEHKVLQYIREAQKKQKDLGTCVIYGLDADLIFLALSTNIKNMYLLRESQQMNQSGADVLNLVNLDTMRKCIYDEIIKKIINEFQDFPVNKLNQQRLIDDFIFICYFLGNDFLPHIPSIDIAKNGLDSLLDVYCSSLIDLCGEYIINASKSNVDINIPFLKHFMNKLGKQEEIIIDQKMNGHKFRMKCQSTDPYDIEIFRIDNLMFKVNDPVRLGENSYKEYSKRYYNHNFNIGVDDLESFRHKLCCDYWEGIVWVTKYYFNKCASWRWYFPYDHGPFLADLSKSLNTFDINSVKFKLSKPLKPLEQLLCVLPPQSSYLLPNKVSEYMSKEDSPLIHLYPIDFKQDFINKRKYWQSIPVLPFLEIDLVERTFIEIEKTLKNSEKDLNKRSKDFIYNNNT
jgi:5'-3' exonuclease